MDPILWVVLVVLVCLLAEGFFSGAELAMVACDKLRLEQRSRDGNRGAKDAEALVRNPARLFSITLLGTNLSTVTASTVTTFYLIKTYGPAYGSLAILISPIILIFAEIIPKSIFHHRADGLVDRISAPLSLFGSIMFPVIWMVQRLTDRLLGGIRKMSQHERRITRDELHTILQGEETHGTDIQPRERTIVSRVLRLADLTAKNVMVPMIELESLPITATQQAALAVFELKGYPRIPVFSHRVYNVIGIVEATDVLCADKSKTIRDLVHQPIFVPEDMPINELFLLLRRQEESAAVVVDEYGGALGLITREDIIEEVVGEIRDEFELDEVLSRKVGEGEYLVNARMEIEEAESALGLQIPQGDYETVGGYLLHLFGRIPRVGESLVMGGWRYVIEQASERTIVDVRVMRVVEPS